MLRLVLERVLYHEDATIGRLYFPGGWCYTLEEAWRLNEPKVSCVPEGWYQLRRGTFRGLYENFEFVHVLGRDAIEIHKGNTDADTEGCVLLGTSASLDALGQAAVVESAKAFDRFMVAMKGVQDCHLAVQRAQGPALSRAVLA